MNHAIITGQYVRIDQTPANIGERLLALALDYLFMGGVVFVFFRLTEFFPYSGFLDALQYIIIPFLLFYSLFFEIFNNGQTPGKRIMGLRVIKADGSVPTLGGYLLRWMLYPIDFIFGGCVGIISMLATRHHQRLGDLAGGTMVIKEKNYRRIHVSLDEFSHLTPDYRPVFPQAADLSLEQVNIIERTLHTPAPDRARRIILLTRKVIETLKLPPYPTTDEQMLETLLRDYQYYALEDI